jgi:hypothetical protein
MVAWEVGPMIPGGESEAKDARLSFAAVLTRGLALVGSERLEAEPSERIDDPAFINNGLIVRIK